MQKPKKVSSQTKPFAKVPTGIKGFDQISFGGIPKGRPTLICGSTGCGKTLMAIEVIVRGAVEFNEPGVFLSFEERKEDLIKNVASMGFDLVELERKKLVSVEYIHIDTRGYTETGDYDLEGLFILIENAVKKINAKRVALDTIEVLFSGFLNESLLRAELRRLFGWIKEKQLTTILTGEAGTGPCLTRYGIEEYVADCVVNLSAYLVDDLHTRRLQIVKYRGSYHESNQFPFIISRSGISFLPITSLDFIFDAPSRLISSGIPQLDACLGGKGFYEGSSILISGSSGCGKTTFAGVFAASVCKRKQKCLFISYEESIGEVLRNLSSVGTPLNEYAKKGLLRILSTRPSQWGLERHLANFIQEVETFKPHAVVIDPVNTLCHCGADAQIHSVLVRMIDYLKKNKITFYLTASSFGSKSQEFAYSISSIIDTFIIMRNEESNGELNRDLVIVKSRGMAQSNQVREFSLSSKGIVLKEPYYGEGGVLTGTSRIIQESKDAIEQADQLNKLEKLQQEIELKKRLIKIQLQGLNAELEFKAREVRGEEEFFKFKEEVANSTRNVLKEHRFAKSKKIVKGKNHGQKRNG